MAIFDLTGGKYPLLITQDLRLAVYNHNGPNAIIQQMIESRERDEYIPVFLVDTAQSNTLVIIPETHVAVKVPEHQRIEMTETNPEESLYRMLRLWELRELPNRIKEPESTQGGSHLSIVDFLGVYTSDNDPIVPRRIFVWVDKINNCASGDIENACALLLQVILHELTHAFLDVTRIGKEHNSLFTYNHPAYRFIEEAFANGISLYLCMDSFSVKQQSFIEQFTLNQPIGYSEGLPIFKHYPRRYVERKGIEWMRSKESFTKSISDSIINALSNFNSGSWLGALRFN